MDVISSLALLAVSIQFKAPEYKHNKELFPFFDLNHFWNK